MNCKWFIGDFFLVYKIHIFCQLNGELKCDILIISFLKDLIMHCMSELQLLERARRDEYIKKLRKHGLSIRQISRLTGISKSVIEKIGR